MQRENVVVVGTGECYHNILAPTLAMMEQEGYVQVLATVDLKEKDPSLPDPFSDRAHAIRKPGQKLSELLKSREDPVVIHAHANECHTPDALDLVENGFRTIVEKPYSISHDELRALQHLIEENPGKVALVEYYAAMKAAPLFAAAGLLDPNSFYFTKEGVLVPQGADFDTIIGSLDELLNNTRLIRSVVLEGGPGAGHVDERGPHLTDTKLGGGMIQDLGLHALTPVLGLEGYVGSIDRRWSHLPPFRAARCNEYIQMAQDRFGLELQNIGESYAELRFTTTNGVPVHVTVGKYTPDGKNQRFVEIINPRGTVALDMNDCVLETDDWRLECPKNERKYFPVLMTAFLELQGNAPHARSVSSMALEAQRLCLDALTLAKRSDDVRYARGADPSTIFAQAVYDP